MAVIVGILQDNTVIIDKGFDGLAEENGITNHGTGTGTEFNNVKGFIL